MFISSYKIFNKRDHNASFFFFLGSTVYSLNNMAWMKLLQGGWGRGWAGDGQGAE